MPLTRRYVEIVYRESGIPYDDTGIAESVHLDGTAIGAGG